MANTTQIFVRNPVGDLTNHGDIHKIQRLTFSLNAYFKTSWESSLEFVVSVLVHETVGVEYLQC